MKKLLVMVFILILFVSCGDYGRYNKINLNDDLWCVDKVEIINNGYRVFIKSVSSPGSSFYLSRFETDDVYYPGDTIYFCKK